MLPAVTAIPALVISLLAGGAFLASMVMGAKLSDLGPGKNLEDAEGRVAFVAFAGIVLLLAAVVLWAGYLWNGPIHDAGIGGGPGRD